VAHSHTTTVRAFRGDPLKEEGERGEKIIIIHTGDFALSYINPAVLLLLGVPFCDSLIPGASSATITALLHKSKAQKISDDHARMVPAVTEQNSKVRGLDYLTLTSQGKTPSGTPSDRSHLDSNIKYQLTRRLEK
jgi:hypothetical protein